MHYLFVLNTRFNWIVKLKIFEGFWLYNWDFILCRKWHNFFLQRHYFFLFIYRNDWNKCRKKCQNVVGLKINYDKMISEVKIRIYRFIFISLPCWFLDNLSVTDSCKFTPKKNVTNNPLITFLIFCSEREIWTPDLRVMNPLSRF